MKWGFGPSSTGDKMRPNSVTVSSQAASIWVPVDRAIAPFNIGFGAVVAGGSTLTYTVEHTFDDILGGATATAFPHATVAAQTTSKDGNYIVPVVAIRLNITAFTSGSVTLTILQGGVR